MSFNDVLAELPALTLEQRQLLIRMAVELDDAPLSVEESALVERRLTGHRNDPASSVALDAMKEKLRGRFAP
ncbi:hypothetical protein CMV30_11550 [Nibricoccus aquaticus]|uniref:Addiction module protein n=1 Tax=Nibricoccus aquaticus TaxID=2576891 RepID=A0A290Q8G1_9BACT|nr:hypothetical protein [Nibricoccus aquaticus]ATC64537.1 hypothetical protein CMV30_11550 [Nibricoccus aquaticus]